MKQDKIAGGLKIFSVLTAAVGFVFFFLYIPELIKELAVEMPEVAWLRWPGTIGIWSIAFLCYAALFIFWNMCTRIGRGNSFCMENSISMKKIGILALAAGVLIVAGDIFLAVTGYLNVAWFLASFFPAFAGAGISGICLSLSRLIKIAADIKAENDLTI